MKFFAIILLAVACAVSADNEVTEEELNDVAEALKTSELERDESKTQAENRAWNPLKKAGSILGKACSCPNGDKCECSFSIPLLKSKGVIGGRLVEGEIELNFNLANTLVLNRRFPLAGRQEVCGRLPKSLSAISFCLTVAALPIPGGVSSCAAGDFRVNNQIGASLNLQCIDIRGGKLSIGGPAKLTKGGPLALNVKAPFVALAKKLTRKP